MFVACFVEENMTIAALKLISQMNHLRFFPSIGVCNSLLGALLRSEQLDLALDFLEDIQSQGFPLNVSIISLFIHAYCTKGNLESDWKLLTGMKEHGIKPDVVAYTILINSLCKLFLLKEATSVLFKMIRTSITLDSVSINGNMDTASDVFEEMLELGLQPDCFSYTTIIRGYCKIGEVNDALNFLGKILNTGMEPSITTYTTLIEGYCKYGEMESGEHLFYKMIKAGLAPDIFAYNTLMDGYGKKGYLHKAFGLLNIMKSAGISPDIVTYNIVIHSLIVRGFVNEAKYLLDELTRRGFSLDLATLINVISGHANKRNFEEAFLVWFYMNEHHIKPDVMTCDALLHGHCKVHRMEEANTLFHKMLDIGLVPNLVLYNTLVHRFCSIGNNDNAFQLINMMIEHGFVPNDATYRALILGYEKKRAQNPKKTATFKLRQMLLEYGLSIDADHYLKYRHLHLQIIFNYGPCFPSQSSGPSYLGFVLEATDFLLEYYYGYIIVRGGTPGCLLAALSGGMGTETASTNIGGSTVDSSVHRHSAVADLLNYVRSLNIRVAVYGSVERIL
ncbi:hypothetical protein LguiA_010803 [Lonicera macranthoides]